jgi:hypothetical protein
MDCLLNIAVPVKLYFLSYSWFNHFLTFLAMIAETCSFSELRAARVGSSMT